MSVRFTSNGIFLAVKDYRFLLAWVQLTLTGFTFYRLKKTDIQCICIDE